jgi:hypothetical protein
MDLSIHQETNLLWSLNWTCMLICLCKWAAYNSIVHGFISESACWGNAWVVKPQGWQAWSWGGLWEEALEFLRGLQPLEEA